MLRKNFPGRKQRRRVEAIERQMASPRTTKEQRAALIERLKKLDAGAALRRA